VLTALTVVIAMAFGVAVGTAGPAVAAGGPAVVAITVSITDPAGAVVSQVDASSMATYSVNVAYSCSVADCAGVQVVIDPTTLDPTYGLYRKETAMTFTPPFSPAPPISGSLGSGYTVALGTVAAGTGGSFSLAYRINSRPAGPQPGSFFVDGSPIQPKATISATNANNPAAGTASATWVSSVPAAPTVGLSAPVSIRTDTPVTINVGGDSRCLSYNGASILIGIPWVTCASSYTAPVTLPADAQYVAGSGGSYDAGTRTVTFAQSGIGAAGGLAFNDNTFQVIFPSGAFPTSGAGCVASEAFSATETMTYLDGTVRTAAPGSTSIQAQNCSPFAKGDMSKTVGSRDAGTPTDAIVDIPLAPGGINSKYWQVEADNQANVVGVATITDNDLSQDGMAVPSMRVVAGGPATVNYTLDDDTTGSVSVAAGATFTPPGGHTITALSATSSPLAGPNSVDTGTGVTPFIIRLNFSVHYGVTPGTRTNTATTSIAYPDDPDLGTLDLGSATATADLEVNSNVTLNAGGPSVTTAGTPIVGGTVSWRMAGAMDNVTAGTDYRPQYVYLAPQGWNITAGSAVVAGVPGVSYDYKTVTYNGDTYDAVVATWPAAVTNVGTFSLPTMTVNTVPTGAATAGTNNQTAYLFLGDVNDGPVALYYPTDYTDVSDLDGDGNTTEHYATRTGVTSLAPSRSIAVTKQICRPDAGQSDGCDWISDSSSLVGVPPNATAIKYRVTLTNSGNVDLNNVVAYDVLPYIGDTGLTDGTASTPRGSTVQEILASVSGVPAGVDLSYSASENPARPQVYSGSTDPDDWGTTVAGASAIRAQVTSLAAETSVTFGYEASLVGGTADQVACNSIAATADTLAPIQPAAVCATTQEADLGVTLPATLPLQSGRPGVLPFTVTDAGPSASAPATATLSIPAGLTVTDYTPDGWSCSSFTAPAAPAVGPVSLTCLPVNTDGSARILLNGATELLNLPVTVTASTGTLTVDGTVDGSYFDQRTANNTTTGTIDLLPAATALTVTKGDGVTAVDAGGTTTYTIEVTNPLVGETLGGAAVSDTIPAGESYVSATGSHTVNGSTVTWTLPTIAAAGNASVTLTVKVAAGARTDITNTATASAPDPDVVPAILSGTASDTDGVRAVTLTKTSDVPRRGVTVGDVITYTVTETNVGSAAFTTGNPARIVDDLSGVLPQASFVTGSAQLAIDGGALAALADPTGSTLAWSGALPAASSAVLTYKVTVTSGVTPVANAVYTTTPTTCTAGADANGLPCAIVTNQFAPALTIVKTATLNDSNGNGTADVGETISYHFLVSNVGGRAASNVTVNDPMVTGITPATATIAPGAARTFTAAAYHVTQADVDRNAPIVNTATAAGEGPAGDPVTSNPASASIPVSATSASLTIVKSATLDDTNGNGVVDAGETIDYAFVVTNTGNVTLAGVTVDDAMLTGILPATMTLAPGQQGIFRAATWTAVQGDIDAGGFVTNTATGTAIDPGGNPVVSLPSIVRTPLADPAPAVTIVKMAALNDTNDNGKADAGETIAYSFLVTNTGNLTVTGVAVDDEKVTGLSPASATLIPGQRETVTADLYTVTATNVASGSVVNTATADGGAPDGDPVVSDPSTVTTVTGPIPPPSDPIATVLGYTGTNPGPSIALAVLLLGIGGLAFTLSRRRRRAANR
jgi:uncharacterized repeat protein (TIGR01451 family)